MGSRCAPTVLIHNLGHHDLHLLRGDPPAPEKVRASRTRAVARQLNARLLDTQGHFVGTPWQGLADGCTRLDAPVTLDALAGRATQRALDPPDAPVTGVRVALLPTILDAWEQETPNAPTRAMVLVSTGELDEASASDDPSQDTVWVSMLLAAWASSRATERGSALEVRQLASIRGKPFRFGLESAHLRGRVAAALDGLLAGVATNDRLDVFLSANTGTLPTLWSLASATRPHQPTVLHVEAAKSIHAPKTAYRAEAHTYDVHDRPVAQEVIDLAPDFRALVAELARWHDEYSAVWSQHQANQGPLESFWLRKGKKPVLAVVAVRDRATGATRYHCGCNLEVSLPTGSLCAERNAIGSALAANPAVDRSDFVAIAVLGMGKDMNPLGPCGVCNEWLLKITEENPRFRVLSFTDTSLAKATCEAPNA